MKINFQAAKTADIPFLLNLRKRTMNVYLKDAGLMTSDEYHLARIKEHFSDSSIICINGKAIGLIKLSKQEDKLHIRQFQILPALQNKGVGSQILQLVIKKAQQLNLPITLNVMLKNPAKSLYEKQGFKVIGQNDLEYKMKLEPKEK